MKKMLVSILDYVTRSIVRNRSCLVATLMAIFAAPVLAQPAISVNQLKEFRAMYRRAPIPVKYVLVRSDGSECCEDGAATPAYLLDITSKKAIKPAPLKEAFNLLKQDFVLAIDDESLISTAQGDYVVMTVTRIPENKTQYKPCMTGMGDERAYLIAVKGRTAKVINRDFGGCGKSYEVIREGTDLGYRVKEQDAATSTRYLLRGGALVEEKMVSREMSRQ